jgi:hypothetical protein
MGAFKGLRAKMGDTGKDKSTTSLFSRQKTKKDDTTKAPLNVPPKIGKEKKVKSPINVISESKKSLFDKALIKKA